MRDLAYPPPQHRVTAEGWRTEVIGSFRLYGLESYRILQANFGEYPFRKCLENREKPRNGGSEGAQEGPKKPRPAASWRRRSVLERPWAISQTVSPRTPVNRARTRAEAATSPGPCSCSWKRANRRHLCSKLYERASSENLIGIVPGPHSDVRIRSLCQHGRLEAVVGNGS
jgi:hypothetical protein